MQTTDGALEYRPRLIPGLRNIPVTLPVTDDTNKMFENWKQLLGQELGCPARQVLFINTCTDPEFEKADFIEERGVLEHQPDQDGNPGTKILTVFCQPDQTFPSFSSIAMPRIPGTKETLEQVTTSFPFCNIERFKMPSEKCPDLIKVIVHQSAMLRKPIQVAKYFNALSADLNQKRLDINNRARYSELTIAPVEIIDDAFLFPCYPAELRFLNEGADYREREAGETIFEDGTPNVQGSISFKVKILDLEWAQKMPEGFDKEITISQNFYYTMRVGDLKRIILGLIKNPFIMKATSGEQFHNKELVHQVNLPQPTKRQDDQYDWEVPIIVCFHFLELKDSRKENSNDVTYLPEPLLVPKVAPQSHSIFDLVDLFAGAYSDAILKNNYNGGGKYRRALNFSSTIVGLDFLLQVDNAIWCWVRGYKQSETPIVESNASASVPGITMKSKLNRIGVSKFSNLTFKLNAFTLVYKNSKFEDSAISKVVMFSSEVTKSKTYEEIVDLAVFYRPKNFCTEEIIRKNFEFEITESQWNLKRTKSLSRSTVWLSNTIAYLGVATASGGPPEQHVPDEQLIDLENAEKWKLASKVRINIEFPEYLRLGDAIEQVELAKNQSLRDLQLIIYQLSRIPPSLQQFNCTSQQCSVDGQQCLCNITSDKDQAISMMKLHQIAYSLIQRGITRASHILKFLGQGSYFVPIIDMKVTVKPDSIRLSILDSYIWKSPDQIKTILDLKKAITAADLELEDNQTMVKASKDFSKMHEHLRLVNSQFKEIPNSDHVFAQESVQINANDRIISLILEMRASLNRAEELRSMNDTAMLNMMSVVRLFESDLQNELDPQDNNAFTKMMKLIEEMENAHNNAAQKYHGRDLEQIRNGLKLKTLETEPEDALREHALFSYTCEGPSYYIKKCLQAYEYSSIQSFLSCILNQKAIQKIKYDGDLCKPVYSGIHMSETYQFGFGSPIFNNTFVSTSSDFSVAQGFGIRKAGIDRLVHMLEIYLTDQNKPQMSIVPPLARYNEQEIILLPNFQFINLAVRREYNMHRDDPNMYFTHRIVTQAEVPFQDHLSSLHEVEDYQVIWFDIYVQESELIVFQEVFKKRFKVVRTEEQLFETLRKCVSCHLILQGSLAMFLIPKLEVLASFSYKIQGIYMWTSEFNLKEKRKLLENMKGYESTNKKVFYFNQKDIISAIQKSRKEHLMIKPQKLSIVNKLMSFVGQ